MRWIFRHRKLVIVSIVAIILVMVMSVSYLYDYSTTSSVKKIGNIITIFQEPFVKAGNGLNKGISGIFRFRTIVRENETLKDEVSSLEQEIIDLQLKQDELKELIRLEDVLNYIPNETHYFYITADVISRDGSNWFNTFTINIGENDGIVEGSIVINGDGLVGRIYELSDNWAKVVSIIDDNHSVSFKILRDRKYIGIVSGNGRGFLEGYLLDPDADVLVGDEIITSGLGKFPEGIPIGTIKEVVKDENKLLKTISVNPHAYFKNINKVLVIYYE